MFKITNGRYAKENFAILPHRKWNDLIIYYQLYKGITVDYNMMMGSGCTEEELYNAAVVNTRRLMPVVLTTLRDEIESIAGVGAIPEDDLTGRTFLITNNKNYMGATAILYSDELEKIAERLDSDLHILPSSLHEILCMSVNDITAENASKMVREVNETEVSPMNYLSDSIYLYSRDTKKVTIAVEGNTEKEEVCGK